MAEPPPILREIVGTINPTWKSFLFASKDVCDTFSAAITQYMQADPATCTPLPRDVFRAFSYSSPDSIRVVILGQDPYPGSTGDVLHADGLCFSSRSPTTPPSLRNIFECLVKSQFINATGIAHCVNTLDHWAEQGVLMLNTKLTTLRGQTNKHAFWLPFTTAVIKLLAEKRAKNPLIYMLWGRDAQEYEKYLGKSAIVLKSAHPSPHAQDSLPTIAKFVNCNHFIRANQIIRGLAGTQIQWSPLVTVTMYLVLPSTDSLLGRWALDVPEARFQFARVTQPADALPQALNKIRGLLSRGPFRANVYVYGQQPDANACATPSITLRYLPTPMVAMKGAIELQKNSAM